MYPSAKSDRMLSNPTFRSRLLVRAVGIALALCTSGLSAQQASGLPDLGSLKPSTAPAFILLGVSPTSVERPAEAADLAFSVFNSTSMLSSVPQNYALEVSPYWLSARPTLTWQQDTTRSVAESLLRTLSVSVGTAELGTDVAPVSGLAGGFRAQVLSGRYAPETVETLKALENSLKAEGALLLRMARDSLETLDEWLQEQLARPGADPQRIRQEYLERHTAISYRVSASPEYQERVKRMRSAFDNLALRRVGPMLEIAGGASWGFPRGTWDEGTVHNWGAWATYSCERCVQWEGGVPFTPVAVLRYLGGESAVDSLGSAVDLGGRLIVGNARYAASVEGVRRQFVGDDAPDALYRVAGILEYQAQEDLWLRASFGRDYRSESAGSLIAQFGVKFNFADQRYTPEEMNGS